MTLILSQINLINIGSQTIIIQIILQQLYQQCLLRIFKTGQRFSPFLHLLRVRVNYYLILLNYRAVKILLKLNSSVSMSDNQKLEVLSNIIDLLTHKHPQSQTQLSLLHGAIKQWADSFYEQLIKKNQIIIQNQHYKQILFAMSESIKQIQHYLQGLSHFHNDANLEIYYKQYLGIVTPLINQLQRNSSPNQKHGLIYVKHGQIYHNFQARNDKIAFKNTHQRVNNLLEHGRQQLYRGSDIFNENMVLKQSQGAMEGYKNLNRGSKDILKNKDLPVTFLNLQSSMNKKQSLRSETKQLMKKQNRYPNHSAYAKNQFVEQCQNGVSQKKVQKSQKVQQSNQKYNPQNPLQYSECLKRLKRELLNLQKQVPKMKQRNHQLEQQIKILEGKYEEKQKQALQYEEKLYLNQKKCNRLQFQISQLNQLNQYEQIGDRKSKNRTAKFKHQGYTNNFKEPNILFSIGKSQSQSTIDIFKQNSLLTSKFKSELNLHKTLYTSETGQEMRMLFLQACTIQQLMKVQESVETNQ